MDYLLKVISLGGLILTIVPSILVFAGEITFSLHTSLMMVGMILWFGTAPFWMKEMKL